MLVSLSAFALSSTVMFILILSRLLPSFDSSDEMLYKCQKATKQIRSPTDYIEFAESLQLLKQYYSTKDDSTSSKIDQCMHILEKQLLPWIEQKPFWPWSNFQPPYKTIADLNATFTPGSRGIVICSCDKFFEFTVHLIEVLQAFKVDLPPILISYIGDDDLSPGRQLYFKSMGVGLLDVTKYFDQRVLRLNGWAVKPFGILAAPFQEVLFMDADTVTIQNPLKMFDDPGYKEDGLILFRDRICHQEWPKQKLWLERNMIKPLSRAIKESDIWKGYTDHQIDSSLLVIDKHRRLWALLATCKLNMYEERKDFYHYFLGDKESFWLGAEMMRESVAQIPVLPGVFGRFVDRDEHLLCGRQLMFDRYGKPFYFNKAVVLTKIDMNRLLEVPTHYEHAGRWVEGDGTNECLHTEGIEVDNELRKRFEELIYSYRRVNVNS
jgi:hypothetical protein